MAGTVAPLGFSVDTSALEKAKQAAAATSKEVGALGGIIDTLSQKSTAAAAAPKTLADRLTAVNKEAKGAGASITATTTATTQAARTFTSAGAAAGTLGTTLERLTRQWEQVRREQEKTTGGAGGPSGGAAGGASGGGIIGWFRSLFAATKESTEGLAKHGDKLAALGTAAQGARIHIASLAASMGLGGGGAAGQTLAAATNAASSGLGGLLGTMPKVGGAAAGVAAGITLIAVATGGLIAATASAQDKFAVYEGRLKNVLGTSVAAREALADLAKTSQASGISFDSTADAFLRVARNAEALGATRTEILQLTDTVQKLGIISGATGSEVSAGMLQLGQALAAGKLNGDELRSIMENMPALAKAIADGMKITTGELRAMGAAGELTSDKVFKAILTQTKKTEEEFKTLPNTVERAYQRMSDSASAFTAKIGKSIESSQILQAIMRRIQNDIKNLDALITPAPIKEQQATAQQRADDLLKRLTAAQATPISTPYRRDAIANLATQYREAADAVQALQEQEDAAAARKEYDDFLARRAKSTANVNLALKNLKEDYDDFGRKQKKFTEDERTALQALMDFADAAGGMSTEKAAAELARLTGYFDTLGRSMRESTTAMGAMDLQIAQTQAAVARLAERGQTPTGEAVERELQIDATVRREMKERNLPNSDEEKIRAAVRMREVMLGTLKVQQQMADEEKKLAESKGLTEAMQKGEAATIKYNARLQATAIVLKSLGDITLPGALELIEKLQKVFEDLANEQNKQGAVNALRAIGDEIEGINAQIEQVANGPYAMRVAAMYVRAAAANRPGGVGEEAVKEQFKTQEHLAVEQRLHGLREETTLTNKLAEAVGDAREQKRLMREEEIAKEQRNVDEVNREDIRRAIEEKNAAEDRRAMLEKNESIREQIAMAQDELALVGQSGVEYAVQVALLQKKRELMRDGVDLGSEEAKQAFALTAELAKTNFHLQKQKEAAAETERIWTKAVEGIQSTFADFFTSVFSGGVKTWRDLYDSLKQIAFRTLGEIAAASVIRPVLSPILSLGGMAGIIPQGVAGQYGGGGFMGGIGGGGVGGSATGGGFFDWLGSIFSGGNRAIPVQGTPAYGAGAGGGAFGGGSLAFQMPWGGLQSAFGGGAAGGLGDLGGGGMFGGFFNRSLGSFFGADGIGQIASLGGEALGMQSLGGLGSFFDIGSTSMGGALGGLFGIGSGIFGLASGGNPISSIAGIASGIMSFIPGLAPFAPIVGILGGLIGSLFGKKKKKMPQETTDVLFDDSGFAYVGDGTSRSGGLGGVTKKMGGAVADEINDILRQYDLKFGPGMQGGSLLSSSGKAQGQIFIAFDKPYGEASPGDVLRGQGQVGEAAADAEAASGLLIAQFFKRAAHEGKLLGAGATDTVLSIFRNMFDGIGRATIETAEEVRDALDFAEKYDTILRDLPATSVETALKDLNKQFRLLIFQAEDYGLATDGLIAKQQKAREQIVVDFNERYRRGNLGFTPEGQITLALEDLAKEREEALREAAYLAENVTGALVDINALEEYYAKRRVQIVEQANQGIITNLQDFYKRIVYGDLAGANPATTLAGAQAAYEANAAQAAAGDRTAAASFTSLANEFLNAQAQYGGRDGAYGAALARVRAATEGLMAQYGDGVGGTAATQAASVNDNSPNAELIAQLAAMVATQSTQITALMARIDVLTDQLRRQNAA